MIAIRETLVKSSFVALVALSLVACAPKAPPELLGARQAYEHARTSDAARLAPAELHVASEALAAAEASFEGGGRRPARCHARPRRR